MAESKISVLIVDDDPKQGEDLAELLKRREGMTVDVARSGEEAITRVRDARGSYDVILADQVLQSEMDGITMMKRVKNEYPDIEVVMFSGQDSRAGLQAVREGAYRYMTKPYLSEELGIVVRQAAEYKRLKQENEAKTQAKLRKRAEELVQIQAETTAKLTRAADLKKEDISKLIEDISKFIVDRLKQLFDAVSCTIRLYEEQHTSFGESIASEGTKRPTNIPRQHGTSWYLIQDKKPIYAENPDATLPNGEPVIREETQKHNIKAVAYLPLLNEEAVIGRLAVSWETPRHFTDEEKKGLELFANQIAIAIQNVKLVQESRENTARLLQLQKVTKIISTNPTDLDNVLRLVVSNVSQIFKGASCEIRLYDAQKGEYDKQISVDPKVMREVYTPRARGVSRLIMEKREPFYAEDPSVVLPSGIPAIHEEMQARGVKAICYLPLVRDETIYGIIYVNWNEPQHFTQRDCQLLELFADQASIAIQNARMFEERERRIRDLGALSKISQGLSTPKPLSVEEMARLIYKEASKLMDLGNFYVAQYDKENHFVTFAFVVEHGAEIAWRHGRYAPRTNGQGLIEYVIQQGELTYIPENVEDWCAACGIRDTPAAHPTCVGKCWLGVPVKVGNEVLGVIGVENCEQANAYNEFNQDVLTAVAAQIGVAMVRQQLSEQNSRLEVLRSVSQAISSTLDLRESMRRVVESALKMTNTDAGLIYAIDSERDVVVESYEYPTEFGHLPTRFSEKRGLTWEVYNTKKITEVLDIPSDDRLSKNFAQSGMKSSIGVPLKLGERVVGVLFLNSKQEHVFTNDEKNLVTLLAEQAAIALENARLYEESEERAQKLQLLYEATRDFSSTLDLEQVLSTALERVRSTLGVIATSVWLIDPVTGELVCRDATGAKAEIVRGHRTPVGKGIGWAIVENGKSECVADVRLDKRHYRGVDEETKLDLPALMCAPLKSRDQVAGVIYAVDGSVGRFTETDLNTLDSIATAAALAIENAKLFEQVQKQREAQIDAIRRIGVNITQVSDLDTVLAYLLDAAIHIMGAAHLGEIRLYEPETDELVVKARQGENYDVQYQRNKIGEGVTGWVAQHRQSRVVADVTQLEPPDYLPFLAGTKSEIASPLLSRGELVGVLNIESPKPDTFTPEYIPLLEAIASQVVMAIENAEGYKYALRQKEVALQRAQAALEQTLVLGELGNVLTDVEQEA